MVLVCVGRSIEPNWISNVAFSAWIAVGKEVRSMALASRQCAVVRKSRRREPAVSTTVWESVVCLPRV